MARYAIGLQDFKGLRKGDYIYVDKTAYIPRLLEGGKYYFLGRPRRFGKSLFVSTLEYFFNAERELFKGLAVDSYDWNWETYPVIHLDLNGANYTDRKEALVSKLIQQLKYAEEKYDIVPSTEEIAERLEYLITQLYRKTGKEVVVLVDEYEKPVLDVIDNPVLSNSYRETLRGFYSVLKSTDKYLKLVFLTGVTKFGKMSVFSGLNNIKDISLDDRYGAICGITRQELIENFREGIESLATKKDVTYEEAVGILKTNYDGYHFSEECPDIYNPYSLLNALDSRKIEAYWAETGTPTLLVQTLLRKNYDLGALDGVSATSKRLTTLTDQLDDPIPLFYQTGYLTIKTYDDKLERFILGYPNLEVEKAFFDFLLPYYSSLDRIQVESRIDTFKRYIIHGEAEKAMEELQAFSSGITYDLIPKPETERHFHVMLHMFATLVLSRNIKVSSEVRTSNGRIDMVIETSDFLYIIEIKRDGSPESALRQIEERDYALSYQGDSRRKILIGLNFSTEKKRLDGFLIKRL